MGRITFFILVIFLGVSWVISCNQRGDLRDQIMIQAEQNHIELLQLINTQNQAEVAFLESLKKSQSNRIKKGDELR